MSNTFFASVRRNQKQWMVVLTVLSMVSFLFFDYFGDRKGPMSQTGGGLLIGCIVAAGMTIVGYPRGMTAEFGIGGFIVGFLAGYAGFGAVGVGKPLVQTSSGQYSRLDLMKLCASRARANQFMAAVERKLGTRSSVNLGNADEVSMIQEQMWLADAKKMGIQISDERVNDTLKQITQGNLTKQQFKECLREAQTTEGELFEQIKARLATQMVVSLIHPPAYLPPISPELSRLLMSINRNPMEYAYMQQTPLQLWSEFQKLTLKESLQAAPIPVGDFVGKVAEPTETEVSEFFARNLRQRWVDDARPGFTKMPSAKLAYLTAEFEKFEKGRDPTDAEISEFYQLNKHDYRITPQKPSDNKDNKSDPSKPDDAAQPESKKDDSKSKEGPTTTTVEKRPTEEASKANTDPKADADTKKDDSKSQNPSDPTADKNAQTPKPPVDEKPADKVELPALSDQTTVKFRELDNELKSEIRDEIIRSRAIQAIGAELDRAYEFMVGLSLEYDATPASERVAKAKTLIPQVMEYAQAHNLEFVETDVLTYDELIDKPLGLAVPTKGARTVADDVFSQLENGEPRTPLYSPRRANSRPPGESYCYWKMAQYPIQPYDLKDEAVRAKVVSAWKFDQARTLAEKRAQDLVAKIKAGGNDLPAALSGETITADKDAPAITVIPTSEFTWLSMNIHGQEQTPSISSIPLIEEIGEKFMQTVFEDLNDGDVGLVANEPRSIFYIVKVLNRDTGKNDEGGVAKYERQQQFLKEEFSSIYFPSRRSPYQILAAYPQRQIMQNWNETFEREHSVEWNNEAQPVQPTRVPRRRR